MKIALVTNDCFSMWRFRKGLITALVDLGAKVFLLTPGGDYSVKLEQLGGIHVPVPVTRFIDPFKDIALLFHLYRFFKRERVDIAHGMAVKALIYTALTARIAGVKRIVGLISGRGFIFSESLPRSLLPLKLLVSCMLRLSFKICDKVWFQNPDDIIYFVREGMIEQSKALMVKGSGVNIEEFSKNNLDKRYLEQLKKEFGICTGDIVVTMIARLAWSKGLREFLESSRAIIENHRHVKFILVAPADAGSPDSVPLNFVESFSSPNLMAITIFRHDVKEILGISDIVVLPSYSEGVPRSVLEGMALEKPIITTDSVGCRETVDEGINGFLIPIRDSAKLTESIEKMVADTALRKRMGMASREKILKEFDERTVAARIIKFMYGLKKEDR